MSIHRARQLHPFEVSIHRRIPITTVPRTLVDLAASTGSDDLAELCHVAGIKYAVTAERVEAVLARRPNAKGAEKLHRIYRGDTRLLLSELERGFLRSLRRAGLPLPETNKKFDEGYVDCRWAEQKVTVELDSYRYHHSRHAWEDGYRRRRAARRRGDRFERFSYGDVFEEPEPTLEEVRALLLQQGR